MFQKIRKGILNIYDKKRSIAKILCCFLIIVSAIGISAKPVFANGDEEKYENSLSLYKVTVAIMDYIGDERKDGNFPGDFVSGTCTGNAGAAAGYSKYTIFSSNNTNASSNNTYNSYDIMKKTKSYAQYGYLLNELGLDACVSKLAMNSMLRVVGGGIVFLLFGLSMLTPVIFKAVISILKTLNPFQLFAGVATINGQQTMENAPKALQPLANLVSSWYTAISDFSWEVVVPMFFAILVVWLLLFKSTDKAKKVKKYVIRIAFIALGVPLLGSCYTTVLNCMDDMAGADNSVSARVIASTFFDFETWATNCRLSVPSDVLIEGVADSDSKADLSPSAMSQIKVRETCYKLNQASGALSVEGTSPFAVDTSDESGTLQWNTNGMEADYSDSGIESGMDSDITGASSQLGQQRAEQMAAAKKKQLENKNNKAISDITNLLLRYMFCSYYEGGMYSSDVGSQLDLKNQDGNHAVTDMMSEAVDAESYKGGTINFTGNANYSGYDIFANGSLMRKDNRYYDDNFCKNATVDKTCGLSTMSMYNYLNTKFTNSGLTFYSGKDTASEYVRASHPSVNIVGTGLTSFLYWLNCVILLGSFAIIGIGYSLGLLFANLKRTIRSITSIPLALLGSIRAIASVITYAIVMIIEIIGTIFMYEIIVNILLSISTLVCTPVMMSAGASKLGVISSGLFLPVSLVFNAIVFVWFIKIALKLRHQVVKALDEGAQDIIGKFLDTKGLPDIGAKQPGMLRTMAGQAAGAVATGAGMAVGDNIMRKVTGHDGPAGDDKDNAAGSSKNVEGQSGDSGSNGGAGPKGPRGEDAPGKVGTTSSHSIEKQNGTKGTPNSNQSQNGSVKNPKEGASAVNGEQSHVNNEGTDVKQDEYSIKDATNDAELAKQVEAQNGLESDKDKAKEPVVTEDAEKLNESSDSVKKVDTQSGVNNKKSNTDVKIQAKTDEITGQTKPVEAENNAEQVKKISKTEKKKALQSTASDVHKTVGGVKEIAAGVATGNPNMITKGSNGVVKGVHALGQDNNRFKQAEANAQATIYGSQTRNNESHASGEPRMTRQVSASLDLQKDNGSMDNGMRSVHTSANPNLSLESGPKPSVGNDAGNVSMNKLRTLESSDVQKRIDEVRKTATDVKSTGMNGSNLDTVNLNDLHAIPAPRVRQVRPGNVPSSAPKKTIKPKGNHDEI